MSRGDPRHGERFVLTPEVTEERTIPEGCAVEDLVHEGRHLAYMTRDNIGKCVHITPEGHAVLGTRLRALAQPADRHE